MNTDRSINITRRVTMPDKLRRERYRRAPDLGPCILFFSGGTALNPLSRALTEYTHNSIHLVTPFDSGGSSRVIRKAFEMLSVGDMRSRLMALADRSVTGNPEIYELFRHRLPTDLPQNELQGIIEEMIDGNNDLVRQIPDPMRKIIRNHLRYFYRAMPDEFDLSGASIGNLILAGGYLNNQRHIDPVVFMFSKLVNAKGTVRTITGENLHIGVDLKDGRRIIGQRKITGKEVPPLDSPIQRIFLTTGSENDKEIKIEIRDKIRNLIEKAELICYPMGSFYSSLIANLLPAGVGDAIRENPCPKVYIPNTGRDPEQFGISTTQATEKLLYYLEQGCGQSVRDKALAEKPAESYQLLNFIICDLSNGQYAGGLDVDEIRKRGIEIIDTELVTEMSHPDLDENRLIETLLSLV